MEDSVCGSGHCHLVPFWQKRLVKVRSQHFRCQVEVARWFAISEMMARQCYPLLASYFCKFISC
ncbi:hypothetical protein [Campylobacter concisus]|uniref:hypothetical protein n=1 Tax=Campylobacter concisus TaxID=199 RepID=UPI003D2EA8BD